MSRNSPDYSRREILKVMSITSLGAVLYTISPTEAYLIKDVKSSQVKRWAMYIDVSKCYGCYACMVACAAENNIPVGVFRTWIERHVQNSRNIFVPKQCNHCDNPPCVKPCPTGATYKNSDGLVLVNADKCIGCGACVLACPYGARFMNPITGVADKCTFCNHRIYQGKLPACVEACPTGARIFGDLNDPNSQIRKLVDSEIISVLKQEYGTKPQIYYRDLPGVANR
jgi:Fe-S-cluster-containing dehydrogenase component